MQHRHEYRVTAEWTGDLGTGTSGYRDYSRRNVVRAEGRPAIEASADATFHGDADRWNPEELLLAALSQCHMLSYLHQAALNGVIVVGYADEATGVLETSSDGSGRFAEVVLHPVVTVAADGMREHAARLHAPAAAQCFIAASMNFPVRHEPTVVVRA